MHDPGGVAPLNSWLVEPMDADVERRVEELRRSPGIEHVVVLPDVHLSQQFCIGTVVGSPGRLYPEAVGGDIGCGMAAVRFDAGAGEVIGDRTAADRMLRSLRKQVPIRRHGLMIGIDLRLQKWGTAAGCFAPDRYGCRCATHRPALQTCLRFFCIS